MGRFGSPLINPEPSQAVRSGGWNTYTVDREATVRLLATILAGQPRLPDAACRERHELFDPVRQDGSPRLQHQEQLRRERAAEVCAGCPARYCCPDVATAAA